MDYIKTDVGPFKALVTYNEKGKDGSSPRPPMDVEVTKSLINMGVRFELLERISRYKWVITCINGNDANNACRNVYVHKSGFSITIPWYFVARKIVIKGVPSDIPEDEFWNELIDSNKNYKFVRNDIYRLRTRKYEDGQPVFINSTSIRIGIRASTIPSHVFMWKTRLEVHPYIPSIRQCFNCGLLSHATKFCKNNAICLTCGENKHTDSGRCSKTPRCVNCEGHHCSLAKECPEVITKVRTTELMASQNIDYNTAKRILMQQPSYTKITSSGNSSPGSSIPSYKPIGSEFPLLPKSLKSFTRSNTNITPGGSQSYATAASTSTPIQSTSGNTRHESSEETLKFWFEKFLLFIASIESDKIPPNPVLTKANCDTNMNLGKEISTSSNNDT